MNESIQKNKHINRNVVIKSNLFSILKMIEVIIELESKEL